MKISATITSIILLSGMLGFGFSPDAFAGHVDDKGKSLGCINGVAKNNPHCEEENPPISCDTSGDGAIDAAEIQAVRGGTLGEAQGIINNVEIATVDILNDNGVIDTAEELTLLNLFLSPNVCTF